MTVDSLAAAALKLPPADRARLAETLLRSLEELSAGENDLLWAEEAQRRESNWDASTARRAAAVFGDARDRAR